VTIVGPASNPRIRLYSDPEMAEYDKLSWLMLGRASEGLGTADAALLQRAAYALLAGDSPGPTDQLLGALGLTELSVKQTEGDTPRHRDQPGQAAVTALVGRLRARRERHHRHLAGDLPDRPALHAAGAIGRGNALDLIWTWRW